MDPFSWFIGALSGGTIVFVVERGASLAAWFRERRRRSPIIVP